MVSRCQVSQCPPLLHGLRLSSLAMSCLAISASPFKGKKENFIFNTFIYFEPVKRFKNRSGMTKFKSPDDSTSKGVLDVLKTI